MVRITITSLYIKLYADKSYLIDVDPPETLLTPPNSTSWKIQAGHWPVNVRFIYDKQRFAAVLVVRWTVSAAGRRREETASEGAVAGRRRRLRRRTWRAGRRPRATALLTTRKVEVESGRVGRGVRVAGAEAIVVWLKVVGAEATTKKTDSRREVFAPTGKRHLAPCRTNIKHKPVYMVNCHVQHVRSCVHNDHWWI